MIGKSRNLFPGGNTMKGYVGFLKDIVFPGKAEKLIILKGGPGVGKSNLMRRIGNHAMEQGHDIELFRCSSDADSLDGMHIPALRVAMVDGTSPHTIDPSLPGAVDGIINLGEFLDNSKIEPFRAEVEVLQGQIGRMFRGVYGYLASAEAMRNAAKDAYSINTSGINSIKRELVDRLLARIRPLNGEGKARELFLAAFTPNGHVNFYDDVPAKEVWRIKSPWGLDLTSTLRLLSELSQVNGYNVERYHCALNSDRIDHILIGNELFITVQNDYHAAARKADLEFSIEPHVKVVDDEQLSTAFTMFDSNIQKALDGLRIEKLLHDQLEQYYIEAMDYGEVDKIFDALTETLFRR